MKKVTQRSENPYKNTDSNKRYYTYDYYLRRRFGQKVAKQKVGLMGQSVTTKRNTILVWCHTLNCLIQKNSMTAKWQ